MTSDRMRFRQSEAHGAYPVSLPVSISEKENSLDPTGQISERLGTVLACLLTVSTAMFASSNLDVRAEHGEGL